MTPLPPNNFDPTNAEIADAFRFFAATAVGATAILYVVLNLVPDHPLKAIAAGVAMGIATAVYLIQSFGPKGANEKDGHAD